ncbi:glycosyltransferase [Terrimonas alba]|uniref:glycosyltransferase n=1 Tax=Terrimonas alba TaxID=3349636 RepID=UPI0035F45F67
MEKLRCIVGGFLGLLPAGGVTWDYIQYPLGLSLLGHDVYYIEDTRLYPVFQKPGSNWDDVTPSIEYLSSVMNYFGMKDRWAYRDEASGTYFGMTEKKVQTICKTADVFINISCSTFMRDEYMAIPKRVLIDSDPMFTQIQYLSRQMFTAGTAGLQEMMLTHNYHFTFGENIGSPDCRIPDCGLRWHTTRQPICLDKWHSSAYPHYKGNVFTTLMNWSAGKKLLFDDAEWGQKDIEFEKVLQLPQYVPDVQLEIVVNKTISPKNTTQINWMEENGWKTLDPEKEAGNWISYQQFIAKSSGEFSVAKETYVKANTGWFSCRSACYLAASRPVVTQDTGWSKFIPSGTGLLHFSNMNEAIDAIESIVQNPEKHAKAARDIAEEYFDSNKILNSLLEKLI